MTDRAATNSTDEAVDLRADTTGHLASLVAALIFGGALTGAARAGSIPLLVAVAVLQGVLILGWAFSIALPGARGSILIAAAAAGGSDFAVMHWQHGRLGTLLPVLGLAVPVMFVHQLARGAARVSLVRSLSGVACLVVSVVALPALIQLRHEFPPAQLGSHVASAVAGAAAAGLVVGYLVDMLTAVPRFDPDVPRGLLALIAAGAVGGSVGYLMMRGETEFASGRGTFVGAAAGILAGLFAIAGAFVMYGLSSATSPSTPAATSASTPPWATRLRPVVVVLLALCILAPEAFLLCLAIRN